MEKLDNNNKYDFYLLLIYRQYTVTVTVTVTVTSNG